MALKRGVEQRKRLRKSDEDEGDTSIPPKRVVRVVNTKILAIRLASLHKLNTAEIKHANIIPQLKDLIGLCTKKDLHMYHLRKTKTAKD